jgi:zinc protease
LGQLGRIGFYQLPLDYLDTYRDKVAAVTQAQIRAAFQKHVQIDQFVTVQVGQQ